MTLLTPNNSKAQLFLLTKLWQSQKLPKESRYPCDGNCAGKSYTKTGILNWLRGAKGNPRRGGWCSERQRSQVGHVLDPAICRGLVWRRKDLGPGAFSQVPARQPRDLQEDTFRGFGKQDWDPQYTVNNYWKQHRVQYHWGSGWAGWSLRDNEEGSTWKRSRSYYAYERKKYYAVC